MPLLSVKCGKLAKRNIGYIYGKGQIIMKTKLTELNVARIYKRN